MTSLLHKPYIYHLALQSDWENALTNSCGLYEMSTLGVTLAQQGYIHCSYANQVNRIANFIYRGTPNVILLTIDPAKLLSPVKSENLEGGTELFPHIYGPLNLNAVFKASPYPEHPNTGFPPLKIEVE